MYRTVYEYLNAQNFILYRFALTTVAIDIYLLPYMFVINNVRSENWMKEFRSKYILHYLQRYRRVRLWSICSNSIRESHQNIQINDERVITSNANQRFLAVINLRIEET